MVEVEEEEVLRRPDKKKLEPNTAHESREIADKARINSKAFSCTPKIQKIKVEK